MGAPLANAITDRPISECFRFRLFIRGRNMSQVITRFMDVLSCSFAWGEGKRKNETLAITTNTTAQPSTSCLSKNELKYQISNTPCDLQAARLGAFRVLSSSSLPSSSNIGPSLLSGMRICLMRDLLVHHIGFKHQPAIICSMGATLDL